MSASCIVGGSFLIVKISRGHIVDPLGINRNLILGVFHQFDNDQSRVMATEMFAIKIPLSPNPFQSLRVLYAIDVYGQSVENESAKMAERNGVKAVGRELENDLKFSSNALNIINR